MKKNRFITPILIVASTGLATTPIVTSCAKKVTIEDVKFNQQYSYVEVGTSKDFSQKITITPAEASKDGLTWSITKSSENNSTVATVDAETGILTGLEAGYVQLTCTSKTDSTKASSEWVVVGNYVPLKDFNFAFDEKVVYLGQTSKIFRTYSPENATTAISEDVVWESDNVEVASVSSSGTVRANTPGVATITATPRDYDIYTKEYKPIEALKKTCKITVDYAPVQYVTVATKQISVEQGQKFAIKPRIYPSTAKQDWSYKIVSQEGMADKITYDTETHTVNVAEDCPKGWAGIVFVADADTSKSAYCAISVQEKVIPVESIAFAEKTKTITATDTWTPDITVLPEEATSKDYYFEFSDTSVADVDPSAPTSIIGKKEGKTTVTVYSQDGKCTDTCELTVEKKIIPVTGITLSESEDCPLNGSITLNPTISPVDATDKTVTWTSSKPEIATVDENGSVTGLKEGTTVITAKTNDGGFEATCNLTVLEQWTPISSISLNLDKASTKIGQTIEIAAAAFPEDASYKHITWHTDDDSVISIQQTDKTHAQITGRKGGIAKVYATALDGSYVTSPICYVSVEYEPLTKFEWQTTSIAVVTGDKKKFALPTIEPAAACKDVTWSSSAPTTVSVDKDGNMTAIKPGQATITCTSVGVDSQGEHMTATCTVDVLNEVIHVQTVSVSEQIINLDFGSTMPLPNVTVTPSNASNKSVIWEIEDEETLTHKVTIDTEKNTMSLDLDFSIPTGEQNTICVKSVDNPDAKASFAVRFQPARPSSIKVKACPKTMNLNEIGYVKADVEPFNARQEISFKSLTPEILSVDQNGKITALSVGEGRIEIQTEDPYYNPATTVCIIQVLGYTSFLTDSWENVCKYANEGVESLRQHYSFECEQNKEFPNTLVGYTRTIFYNNLSYLVRVVDMEHDKLDTKDKGKAALTFELVNVLCDENGNAIKMQWGKNARDYNKSPLHDFLWGECLTKFKDENPVLGQNIKKVKKQYHYWNFWSWPKLQERGAWLFPLSAKEMNVGGGTLSEGSRYSWYNIKKADSDKIHKDLNGNPQRFWLITPFEWDTAETIGEKGERDILETTNKFSVVFGFCI